MADVRSLLRSERASRRITHPHATYSKSGALVCLACNLQLKSEALWDPHVRSNQHAQRLQRAQEGALAKPLTASVPTSKKRKADNREGSEGRKKSKAEEAKGLPAGFFSEDAGGNDAEADTDVLQPNGMEANTLETHSELSESETFSTVEQEGAVPSDFFDPANPQLPPPTQEAVDEEEWAAFERDLATPPPEVPIISVLNVTATVQAAPISAEELAARAIEDLSTQRGRRDEELVAEKEDAARHLEEEFDEMEGLEERVRRLKEKRDALRKNREGRAADVPAVEPLVTAAEPPEENEESDDEDYDDEWGTWR
ncbi:hypothetical protein BJ546DRAFT_400194 [Cryomyces antarcticus]